jgi:two-component system, NtrC family, response regulator GlrR
VDPDPDDDTRQTATAVTQALGHAPPGGDAIFRRFRLTVVEGPAQGTTWESTSERCSIGSHHSNDLVIEDATVSRFHCELTLDQAGTRVRDLGSANGTVLDGVPIVEGFARSDSLLRLGLSVVNFQFCAENNRLALATRTELGPLVGSSVAMRKAFALLEKAAASDATILLEGETGTGKEGAATAVHESSARAAAPFVVVDCGAVPAQLIESELFGHEKGAFTGASGRRVGAFEEAAGGTIFLDEIGELPLDVQPKLLRVLEQRQVRRVGANVYKPIDVRVIAATNRDLRAEVNAGRFRSDLYYRLGVVRIRLPSLRERLDDIPLLVEKLLAVLHADDAVAAPLRAPEFLARLQGASWPGNVRELRNYLERCLVFDATEPLADGDAPAPDEPAGDGAAPTVPAPPAPAASDETVGSYDESRRRAIQAWERRYVDALLRTTRGNVDAAARIAGIARAHMYRLVSRHRLLGRHRPTK